MKIITHQASHEVDDLKSGETGETRLEAPCLHMVFIARWRSRKAVEAFWANPVGSPLDKAQPV